MLRGGGGGERTSKINYFISILCHSFTQNTLNSLGGGFKDLLFYLCAFLAASALVQGVGPALAARGLGGTL